MRNALIATVRQELAEARGTARAMLAAAETARDEAQSRRRQIRDAYAACLDGLSAARAAARSDIRRRFRSEASALAADLRSVSATYADAAGGMSWPTWAPDRDGRPGMLRIGTVVVESEKLPALVPLLDAGHLQLSGDRAGVHGVIAGLLLRALAGTRPGEIRLTVHDPGRLGGPLAAFAPLGGSSAGLGGLLDELTEHIRRVHESGSRPEPWRVVVLLADAELTDAERARLDHITRAGVAAGVHLVVRGLDLGRLPGVCRVAVRDNAATCDTTGDLTVRLDAPPPPERVAAFCRALAGHPAAGPPPAQFTELEPAKLWTESSAYGLRAPIGDSTDGSLIEVPLGDDPPHALIGGPPGSGTTNLLYAWLGSLAARYGPEELALYLLDFKGMSFARFAPGPLDPSWLPQVRLAGINVTGDREFGLATLRHLGDELRARAQAAKRFEAGRLADLRAEDPVGHWPRIVAVIDDFQVLLAGRDAVAEEAVTLLDDLARRGRSQGIHLVLASQDPAGVEALHRRSGLIAQFTLRIALPKARRILADANLAAAVIPRFHAVVNADSGLAGANRIVRLPDAGDRTTWRRLQGKLWHARPDSCAEPRLFDGAAVPRLPQQYRPAGRVPEDTGTVGSSPGAVLGERIDVAARPAQLRLGRMPGRNLAVLGTRTDEVCDVLAAAALSLAAQGPAHFSVVCAEPSAEHAAVRLVTELPEADWYDTGDVAELFEVPPDGIPHYVLGYGLDLLGPSYRDRLRTLLADGPEQRTHVLGWWRSVARLRDDLGGAGARFDTIGAWVALDVPGVELSPVSPLPGGPVWHPRRRRALFFDRSVHRTPEVIIPYEVHSADH